jgi:hydroxymethylbilane synthase
MTSATRSIPARTLVVGTRGSKLALVQTGLMIAALERTAPDVRVEVRVIKTEGDRNQRESLTAIGGRGVFVREIEEQLLAGEIDLAVHSLKDLPATQPPGICLAAVPERGDPRDVLISKNRETLDRLANGARIGSSSERRSSQLLALRPDLQNRNIRGNVDTRLRKLDEGQYDAIVVAAAGIARLELKARISQYFDVTEMLPAVAQGALVVECRESDPLRELLAPLDHAPTRTAITAERAFLRGLGGGCQLPIAAHATLGNGALRLEGLVAQPDGKRIIRDTITGAPAAAEALGAELAERVLRDGGAALLEANDQRR